MEEMVDAYRPCEASHHLETPVGDEPIGAL